MQTKLNLKLCQLLCIQCKKVYEFSMENNPLELDVQLCHKFYVASNAITRLYRPYLKEINLTYPQYLIMMVLWKKDREQKNSPLKAIELSQISKIDSGALSLMLNKLLNKGFILISSDKTDKRQKLIKVSAIGRKLYKKAQCVPSKMIPHFEHMTEKDFDQLNTVMRKLLAGLS